MTLQEFLATLPATREQFVWGLNSAGELRATLRDTPADDSPQYCPLTAAAAMHSTEEGYLDYPDPCYWQDAAGALDVTWEDAVLILEAADYAATEDPQSAVLREALLQACFCGQEVSYAD